MHELPQLGVLQQLCSDYSSFDITNFTRGYKQSRKLLLQRVGCNPRRDPHEAEKAERQPKIKKETTPKEQRLLTLGINFKVSMLCNSQ